MTVQPARLVMQLGADLFRAELALRDLGKAFGRYVERSTTISRAVELAPNVDRAKLHGMLDRFVLGSAQSGDVSRPVFLTLLAFSVAEGRGETLVEYVLDACDWYSTLDTVDVARAACVGLDFERFGTLLHIASLTHASVFQLVTNAVQIEADAGKGAEMIGRLSEL